MKRITAADFSPREGDFLDEDLLVEEVFPDGTEGEAFVLPAGTMVTRVRVSETDEHSVSEFTFRTPSGESWRVEVGRMAPGRGWLVGTRVVAGRLYSLVELLSWGFRPQPGDPVEAENGDMVGGLFPDDGAIDMLHLGELLARRIAPGEDEWEVLAGPPHVEGGEPVETTETLHGVSARSQWFLADGYSCYCPVWMTGAGSWGVVERGSGHPVLNIFYAAPGDLTLDPDAAAETLYQGLKKPLEWWETAEAPH